MKFRYHQDHLKQELRLAKYFSIVGLILFLLNSGFNFGYKITFIGPSFIITGILSFLWVEIKKRNGYLIIHKDTLKKQWWEFDSHIECNNISKINYFFEELQIYQDHKCLNINMRKVNEQDLKKLIDLIDKIEYENKHENNLV